METHITIDITMFEDEFKQANWACLAKECDRISGLLPRVRGYKWVPTGVNISMDGGTRIPCSDPLSMPCYYDRKVNIHATFKKARK